MKTDLTEIVVVLDESGSMHSIETDATGGFNKFLEEQKAIPGEANITVVKFNTVAAPLYEGVRLADAKTLDKTNYKPGGNTALYDAVGQAVDNLGKRLAAMNEADRPGKVIMVIITDGEENSSKEYRQDRIKQMVEHQRSVYKWEFVFLAANQDAALAGGRIGVAAASTFNFAADSRGMHDATAMYCKSVASYRTGGSAAIA